MRNYVIVSNSFHYIVIVSTDIENDEEYPIFNSANVHPLNEIYILHVHKYLHSFLRRKYHVSMQYFFLQCIHEYSQKEI